jgi:hypothetical protein
MLNRELVEILESIVYSKGVSIYWNNPPNGYGDSIIYMNSLNQKCAPYLLAHEFGHHLHESSLEKYRLLGVSLAYNLSHTKWDDKKLRRIRIAVEKKAWNHASYILRTIDPQFNKDKFKKYSTKCIQTYQGIY